MHYYDDRDFFYDSDSIDDLYDDEMIFEEEEDDDTFAEWEYDYHRITDELTDE